MGVPPLPYSQLFEVHGSELKPDPVGNLGQASVLCIPHGMLLFGVRKDPFDGLLAPLVQLLIFRRIPDVVRQLLVALPDMPLYRFHTIFGMGAQRPCRTARAYLRIALVFPVSVPVGRAVFQWLILRAEDAVVVFVIHILPPLVPALHRLRALVGRGQHPAVIEHFLTDVRGLVRRIRHDRFHFWERTRYFVIYIVKCHTVMHIPRSYHRFHHKAVVIAGCVRFIGKLPFVLPLHKQPAVRVGHAPHAFPLLGFLLPPLLLLLRCVVPFLLRRPGWFILLKRLFPVRFPVRVHFLHQFPGIPLRCRRDFLFYLFLYVRVCFDVCPVHIYHFWRKVSRFGYFLQYPCKHLVHRFLCEPVPEVVAYRGEVRRFLPQRVSQKPTVRIVQIYFFRCPP